MTNIDLDLDVTNSDIVRVIESLLGTQYSPSVSHPGLSFVACVFLLQLDIINFEMHSQHLIRIRRLVETQRLIVHWATERGSFGKTHNSYWENSASQLCARHISSTSTVKCCQLSVINDQHWTVGQRSIVPAVKSCHCNFYQRVIILVFQSLSLSVGQLDSDVYHISISLSIHPVFPIM